MSKGKNKLGKVQPRLEPAADRLVPGESWRSDKRGSTARGYTYEWQRARLDYLAEHPLCVMCKAAGRVSEATIVDHRTPHRGDQVLFWDRSNWQALCVNCHSMHKQRIEARGY